MFSSAEILTQSIAKGTAKVKQPLAIKILLGVLGGALIGMGFLAAIRVSASSFVAGQSTASLLSALVFPLGLVAIVLAGGELATGNMMVVGTAAYARRIRWRDFWANQLVITISNIIGGVLAAYLFGHVVGLTHTGIFKETLVGMAQGKVTQAFWPSFVSGIGCNWLVGLAVWLGFGAKDSAGKILGIWFPTMVFVAIGFQHSIANSFLIPAAIFEGGVTWAQFAMNLIPVYLGNVVGGAGVVAGGYYLGFKQVQ